MIIINKSFCKKIELQDSFGYAANGGSNGTNGGSSYVNIGGNFVLYQGGNGQGPDYWTCITSLKRHTTNQGDGGLGGGYCTVICKIFILTQSILLWFLVGKDFSRQYGAELLTSFPIRAEVVLF